MTSSSIVLVNTNVSRPPVSPVGLEYVGETLIDAGIPLKVIDLSFETDWKAALKQGLGNAIPVLTGLSVRNIDDSSFISKQSFLPWIKEVTEEVRRQSDSFILLGGVGFSTDPLTALEYCRADAGIAGDGEDAIQALYRRLSANKEYFDLPNIVYRQDNKILYTPRAYVDLKHAPPPRRRLFDNKRYEQLGAIVGIETKRGCTGKCIFCADPVAKGNSMRLRLPRVVVQEFQDLLSQGVSWFHLADSEFNQPINHAKDICRAIIDALIGDKIHWYTYASPAPFDRELARLMKQAGCAGINFGMDSLHDEQLGRLCREHNVSDIEQLVGILEEEGINYMADLLIGCPGENEETLRTTIETAKRLDIPLVGMAAGIRVYEGTQLKRQIDERSFKKGSLITENGLRYYMSPELGADPFGLIQELTGGDERFLTLANPGDTDSYNYADDEHLSDLIRQGARGAYWDILRKSRM
jgi:radical SAM superfamily enzyme YgiQ (UPF0313 family)